MKNMLMLLCAAGFLAGCKPAQPAAKTAPATPPPAPRQTQAQPQTQTQPQAAGPAERQGIVQEISQAVDYGTGAAQLRAKKSAVDRIKQANQQQQRQHQEALDQ